MPERLHRLGALTKLVKDCQAQSRVHLRELLAGQERYVFTLIHKFSTADREPMPVLSERDDIIVITDEAHRSQYDQLAANMRRALPNAAFIGFTGTPLIAGQEERTREVFGDYVSIYNFAQSIADGATVPLYYEARKPELQLAADELKDELDALLDEAALDEEQEKKLQQTFGKQYHLITRNDRLDEIATDLVRHFSARGYLGKAMFVAIDKATAVRMYDKVRKAWATELASREAATRRAPPNEVRPALAERLDWMRSVDMAVVVSQSQNEIDDLKQKGLDILPHRERMQKEDLETKFKRPRRPAAARVRLRDVDHRLRRADLQHDLSRQADEEPHADADHRARQPSRARQERGRHRGLRRRLPEPPEGAGHLRRKGERQHSDQGQRTARRRS